MPPQATDRLRKAIGSSGALALAIATSACATSASTTEYHTEASTPAPARPAPNSGMPRVYNPDPALANRTAPIKQPPDDPRDRAVQVQSGDNLSTISHRFSVNIRALIETNALTPPYVLRPGSVIYLPPPNIHVVEPNETIYSVARRFSVDTRSLALLNGLPKPWKLIPGDQLLLPPLAREGQAAPPGAPPRAASTEAAPAATRRKDGESALKASPARPLGEAPPLPTPGVFAWPATGSIIVGFGEQPGGTRNDGFDLAVAAGAEIRSIADGDVIYADDELPGFGRLILVRHEHDWVSAYALTDQLRVKSGDKVRQGQTIAVAAATGRPRLHFELRKGRQVVDPAKYLAGSPTQ